MKTNALFTIIIFGTLVLTSTSCRIRPKPTPAPPITPTSPAEQDEPISLIIMYDRSIGSAQLLQAVLDYGAKLQYEYSIIPGIAILLPSSHTDSRGAVRHFKQVPGVTSVTISEKIELNPPRRPPLEDR